MGIVLFSLKYQIRNNNGEDLMMLSPSGIMERISNK